MSIIEARRETAEATAHIRAQTTLCPGIGLILGSGLSSLANEIDGDSRFPYSEIPHFRVSTVAGHAGELILGTLSGQAVCAMTGRLHFYEGYSMQQVTFPVRVMQAMGIHTLIVTNAAGGLNSSFHPGDLMIIRDHINLIGMAGLNPLVGPNDDELGPRFPDMAQAYDPGLRRAAQVVAQEAEIPIHDGVYICLAGPTYETPADTHFLRIIGADAVGMSTVPEVTVARHMGVSVLGISGITNIIAASGDDVAETSHEEVLAAGKLIVPRLITVVRGVLGRLA